MQALSPRIEPNLKPNSPNSGISSQTVAGEALLAPLVRLSESAAEESDGALGFLGLWGFWGDLQGLQGAANRRLQKQRKQKAVTT